MLFQLLTPLGAVTMTLPPPASSAMLHGLRQRSEESDRDAETTKEPRVRRALVPFPPLAECTVLGSGFASLASMLRLAARAPTRLPAGMQARFRRSSSDEESA